MQVHRCPAQALSSAEGKGGFAVTIEDFRISFLVLTPSLSEKHVA